MRILNKNITKQKFKISKNTKLVVSLVLLFLLTFFCLFLSVKYDVNKRKNEDIWNALFKYDSQNLIQHAIRRRFIVSAAIILSISSICVGGLIMQCITKNDLASPGIVGLMPAAKLGLTILSFYGLAIPLGGKYVIIMVISSLPVLLIILLSKFSKGHFSGLTLIFTGIALGIIFSSIEWFLMFGNVDGQLFIESFLDANFNSVREKDLKMFGALIAIPIVLLFIFSRNFTLLETGEELSLAIGTKVNLVKTMALMAIILMIPAAVMIGGNLIFVGLSIPHLSKLIMRTKNYTILIPATILIGSIFILLTNIITSYINVNIAGLISIITAPFFIYFARRMNV